MDGLEYSTRFPFGAISAYFQVRLLLVSGSVYTYYHPTIHVPSYKFSPTLHGPYPTHLTSATHIRSPETASGITLPSATRSPWSPKTLHLASTTWGIGEDSKHIDSPRSEKIWRTQKNAQLIQSVIFLNPLFGGHQQPLEGSHFHQIFQLD